MGTKNIRLQRATGPKYPHSVALELLDFKSKYDAGFQVYELKKVA